jgi:hypothetical protein
LEEGPRPLKLARDFSVWPSGASWISSEKPSEKPAQQDLACRGIHLEPFGRALRLQHAAPIGHELRARCAQRADQLIDKHLAQARSIIDRAALASGGACDLLQLVQERLPGAVDRRASECSSRIARWFGVRNWNALKINGAASPQTFC